MVWDPLDPLHVLSAISAIQFCAKWAVLLCLNYTIYFLIGRYWHPKLHGEHSGKGTPTALHSSSWWKQVQPSTSLHGSGEKGCFMFINSSSSRHMHENYLCTRFGLPATLQCSVAHATTHGVYVATRFPGRCLIDNFPNLAETFARGLGRNLFSDRLYTQHK